MNYKYIVAILTAITITGQSLAMAKKDDPIKKHEDYPCRCLHKSQENLNRYEATTFYAQFYGAHLEALAQKSVANDGQIEHESYNNDEDHK